MKLKGLWICTLFVMTGCQKPADYLYIFPDTKHIARSVKIKEMVGTNTLDILWVIDNSGSMERHQQNVFNNLDLFINSLVSTSPLKWKMGLISTSTEDMPFAGFGQGNELVSSDPQAADRFKAAIRNLGTNGDPSEKTFEPIVQALQAYPNFSRPGAALAIIVISDAPEQSQMSVAEFSHFLSNYKGDNELLYFYGFLNPEDWCNPTDDAWEWAGSPFETLTKTYKGEVYKLCDPQFASNLSQLGKNLGKTVSTLKIYLQERPLLSSLQVVYNGKPLPGGLNRDGGVWVYRYDINAIEFTDISFAPGLNESVQVIYEKDNGYR